MMIGLLQSGTGIGSGICPPRFARGLLDLCDAEPDRERGLRSDDEATCLKASAEAPAPAATPAAPPRPDVAPLTFAAPTPECAARLELRGGWTLLFKIVGAAATTLGADGAAGASAAGATGGAEAAAEPAVPCDPVALDELAEVLPLFGEGPPEEPLEDVLELEDLPEDLPGDVLEEPPEEPPEEPGCLCG
jgi:hypothetical protein